MRCECVFFVDCAMRELIHRKKNQDGLGELMISNSSYLSALNSYPETGLYR